MTTLLEQDAEIRRIIDAEAGRQKRKIVLIASENYASKAVLEAQGSILNNKYAEGYPGRRYYGGCEFVDHAESLAIERAKELFGAEHVNVQPHSGAQANMGVYFSLIEPGDTVMGLRLDQGGHLTHGSPVNFSGRYYNFVSYGLDPETEQIDYDDVAKLAREHQPKIIVAGATAYPRVIEFKRFREIADEVGALLMVDMAHIAGLIAAGVHPSCIPHAQVVTTTTHKTLRGPRGAMILCDQDLAKSIDKGVFPRMQGGPFMHAIAAKAVAFGEALRPEFKTYQRSVVDNARILANQLQELGFRIVSGGTDNHLMLVDVSTFGLTGKEAEEALDAVNITANKNAIPNDPKPPRITSGLRVGTPAVTSRGFGGDEMAEIARLMHRVVTNIEDERVKAEVTDAVGELTSRFPVPGIDY